MLLLLYSPFLFPSPCPNLLQQQGQRGEGTGVHSCGQRHIESPQNGKEEEGRGTRVLKPLLHSLTVTNQDKGDEGVGLNHSPLYRWLASNEERSLT